MGRPPALQDTSVVAQVAQRGRSLHEMPLALFDRFPLAVCAGDLRTVTEIPFLVALDNRRELIMKFMSCHDPILLRAINDDECPPCRRRTRASAKTPSNSLHPWSGKIRNVLEFVSKSIPEVQLRLHILPTLRNRIRCLGNPRGHFGTQGGFLIDQLRGPPPASGDGPPSQRIAGPTPGKLRLPGPS
jgi:hypothetical protein